MHKWFVLVLVLCVAAVAQAEEGKKKGKGDKNADVTKAQFVERQQKMAEKKGQEFDKAKVEARFDKMDKNGDGILTADEKPQGKGKKKKQAEE